VYYQNEKTMSGLWHQDKKHGEFTVRFKDMSEKYHYYIYGKEVEKYDWFTFTSNSGSTQRVRVDDNNSKLRKMVEFEDVK